MAKTGSNELSLRDSALAQMTESTRAVAVQFDKRLKGVAVDSVKAVYELGEKLRIMRDNPAKFGENFAKQIGDYFSLPGGETGAHQMINLVDTFEKKWILDEANIPMTNNVHLSPNHFFQLAELSKESDRAKLLKRCREESMSVRGLKSAVVEMAAKKKNQRSGGRKPQRPQTDSGIALAVKKKTANLENFFQAVDDWFNSDLGEDKEVTEKEVELTEEALVGLKSLEEDTQEKIKTLEAKLENLKERASSAGPEGEGGDEEDDLESPDAEESDDEEEEEEDGPPELTDGEEEEDEEEEEAPPAPKKKVKGKTKGKGKRRARAAADAD